MLNNHRELISWSSSYICTGWISSNSWSNFNSMWTEFTATSIADNTSSTDYQYWNNAVSNGYIYINNFNGQTMSLYQQSSVGLTLPFTWVWRIVANDNVKVTVSVLNSKVFGDTNNFDFSIMSTQGGINYSYSSSSWNNWGNTTLELSLSSVSYLYIKTKKSNTSFSYQITVSQTSSNSSESYEWIVFFVLIILFVFFVLIFGLVLGYILRRLNIIKVIPNNNDNIQLNKLRYIDQTLSKMRYESYRSLKYKYDQITWSIWLEPYSQECKVIVTNEWSHVFHREWLYDWFWNIRLDLNLKWPNWNSIVTPESTPALITQSIDEYNERDMIEIQMTQRNLFERTIIETN